MSTEESESITKTLYKIYDSHINKTVAKTIIYIAQKENWVSTMEVLMSGNICKDYLLTH